ncbi:uncharacterized protein LOC116305374 isoform X2 [Actinia tenebrosa]|nr:uncharacterized protein LOC116305374 isoform X2 [Actinia tenebrosa]XP_031571130.1 uncharacterized protein LOC116305374 isoform X2 [Actinia tenebrosa]
MSNVFNNGRSLLPFRTLISLILLLVIILNDAESKALQSSDPVQSVDYSVLQHQSTKWFSWKFCGKLGDVCKPGSRKHCCSVGFTCVIPLKQLYKKSHHRRRFGRCEPVPTIAMKYREFNAVIDPTKKQR